MSHMTLSKTKRTAAWALALFMLMVMLASSFFISTEINHHCDGEDCPICACIQQCENTLRQVGDGTVLLAVAIIPLILFVVSAVRAGFDSLRETLVSQKVRLNN